jgi:hypothetical protein
MASRSFHKMLHGQQGLVKIEGSFAPNGSSALVSTSTKGKAFTVARTGVGVFVVTLNDKYAELISTRCGVQLSALADTDVLFGPIDVISAKTVTILVKTAGVAADIAANANNRIHFSLTLRNTAVA